MPKILYIYITLVVLSLQYVKNRGVDLRRFYKHFSVVITVPSKLFAGVFRPFCISWRPRGLDSSPAFSHLQQLSSLLSFPTNSTRRLQRWFVSKLGPSPVTTAANPLFSIFSDTTRSVPPHVWIVAGY